MKVTNYGTVAQIYTMGDSSLTDDGHSLISTNTKIVAVGITGTASFVTQFTNSLNWEWSTKLTTTAGSFQVKLILELADGNYFICGDDTSGLSPIYIGVIDTSGTLTMAKKLEHA